ncbi:MAG: hypothetical protein HF314_14310 [Ignavibacteria bacterium]|jgi:hypothetical protein|nr:hypothetical protein [Ignavibacteria bacterium]MCU7504253.1 hypothetical protein [Ignavibacteria bacterium]MCU7516098.1 hypothetical protein [Ignavibacteria bacterium]
MASKIVDYKLCDRNFDCDNCLFDKSMRNIQHFGKREEELKERSKGQNIIQAIINEIEHAEFKNQMLYFKNHLVVKNLFANTYYMGFSPVAIDLLDNSLTGIEYCNASDKVQKGDPFLKLNGTWGSVTISSPINFSCLGNITNPETQIPHERWVSLIETSREELGANTIPVSDYHRDIISVTRELTRFEIDYPEVGLTMMDGGTDVQYLYEVIGREKYLSILKTLFK